MLDLDYKEDSSAEVDLNVVMTSGGPPRRGAGHGGGAAVRPRPARSPARARRRRHGAHRGGAAAGGRRPPMSRLRAVLATGNAGKAAELSRLLGRDVEAARDRGRGGRRHVRGQRAAQGARRARGRRRRPHRARRRLRPRGRRARRRARSALRALGGPDRRRPQQRPCSRAWTAPPTARPRSCARSPRCCPTGARSWSRSGSTGVIADAPRGGGGLRLRPALRARAATRAPSRSSRRTRRTSSRTAGAPRARSRPRSGRPASREPRGRVLLPFVVALPPGAVAPPPGAVPRAAQVTVLDRELGLVAVRLPKRGVAASLRRLRAAPGVRYVERDVPVDARAGEGCERVGADAQKADPGWRSAIHLTQRSAAGMVVGIADSGVDDDRLAPLQAPPLKLSAGGSQRPQDPLGHGTAVASLLVANRPDVGRRRPRPGRDAAVRAHRQAAVVRGLRARAGHDRGVRLAAQAGRAGRQRLGDGAASRARSSTRCGRSSSRARSSSRPSATAGASRRATPSPPRSPACSASVRSRRAPRRRSGRTRRAARRSTSWRRRRASRSSRRARRRSTSAETALTPAGTSFAAPLVTGAAAMVWATHRDWSAAEVASALVRSATPLGSGAPSRDWGAGPARRARARCAPRGSRIRTSRTTGSRPRSASGPCTPGRWSSRASATRATGSTPTRSTCPRARRRGRSCARAAPG